MQCIKVQTHQLFERSTSSYRQTYQLFASPAKQITNRGKQNLQVTASLPDAAGKIASFLKPRKCKTCYGAGFFPCTVCHGRGKVHGILPEAPAASPCTHCVRGRMLCQKCKHTGIANYWLWSPSTDPDSTTGIVCTVSRTRLTAGLPVPCAPAFELARPVRSHMTRPVTSALPPAATSLIQQLPAIPLIALGLATGISMWACFTAWRRRELPSIQYPTTSSSANSSQVNAAFHQRVIEQCPTLLSVYNPVPFLTNGHVETIYAAKFRKSPVVHYIRECLLMPDGGCVTLDWEHQQKPDNILSADAPILLLLPGLTGGSHDSYVLHAVKRAASRGMRAVVFNSRGTSDSPVTVPQYYSASFTDDMRAVVAHIHERYPEAPFLAAGWSLGANILVRYLGEEKTNTPICAAVSLCNPFNLTISNQHLTQGFNKIYDINLANSLKNIHSKHEKLWAGVKGKFKLEQAATCRTIREFDDAITIHSFGWPSVDAYYAASSSSLSIPHVSIPLLCIQALDDPIAPKEAIPYQELGANPNTVLVTTPFGGHLGWCSGDKGPRQHPWSDQAMMEWLESVTQELQSRSLPVRKPLKPLAQVLGKQRLPIIVSARLEGTANGAPGTYGGEAVVANGTHSSDVAATENNIEGHSIAGERRGDAVITIPASR